MSICKTSRIYCVPKSMLIDKIKNRYSNLGNIGGPTVLTKDEEEILVKWIIKMGS